MTARPPWIEYPTHDGVQERLRYYADPHGICLHFELHDVQFGYPLIDGEARIRGHVKWDGTLNWETHKNLMCQFIGPGDSMRLHQWFLTLWRLGRDNLSQWDADMDDLL
ncbi:hypothetical protein CcrC1_gp353 [Caulobacter phage C1]|nr:hypothetical protein CcrC1_gp353 [Caulobacter phage C1]UTU08582.1 hypothetical protein CcrC2_gp354 [Caulobacter phage C2]UTU09098.1 hypothetical protein CcrJ4_gp349 [Caulobacter phage J4]UTU09656.1 hypothetical protein CcrBL47_gp371 [Caulobacter phage BL47]WGN97249.1 hypothetical protein [Bertelyvirus sp.]